MAFDVPENLTRHLIVGGVSNPLANCIQNCSSRDEILSARFDVQATLPQDVHRSQYGAILQQWLQERFKLNAHLENRELPAYALIVAREGRLGPQLRRSKQDCASWYELKKTEPSASEPTDAQGRRLCSQGPLGSINELRLVWRGAGELSSLVNNIRGDLDRPIVDRTGLKGYFEWELTYEVPGLREASPNAMAKVPSLEVALAEQLGLRVVSTTAPFEVLIIESVAMPTPN
jgi:uncharacterized protein (TIGR03435 family)